MDGVTPVHGKYIGATARDARPEETRDSLCGGRVMAIAYGVIPRSMTTEDPWDNQQHATHQVGHALRKDFTGYLARTYYGMEIEERLAQLEEIDWRMWKAFTLKQHRKTAKEIAAEMRCSVATANLLLRKARAYLQEGIREHDDYEAKLTML